VLSFQIVGYGATLLQKVTAPLNFASVLKRTDSLKLCFAHSRLPGSRSVCDFNRKRSRHVKAAHEPRIPTTGAGMPLVTREFVWTFSKMKANYEAQRRYFSLSIQSPNFVFMCVCVEYQKHRSRTSRKMGGCKKLCSRQAVASSALSVETYLPIIIYSKRRRIYQQSFSSVQLFLL
jgi:hypothetical protein